MEAQEAALKHEKQQQAVEFQQFIEERKKWEQEKQRFEEQRKAVEEGEQLPRGEGDPREVFLGAAYPEKVAAGEGFVARFMVYSERYEPEVLRAVEDESPDSKKAPRLGTRACHFERRTRRQS